MNHIVINDMVHALKYKLMNERYDVSQKASMGIEPMTFAFLAGRSTVRTEPSIKPSMLGAVQFVIFIYP